jgi:hypothetical protein
MSELVRVRTKIMRSSKRQTSPRCSLQLPTRCAGKRGCLAVDRLHGSRGSSLRHRPNIDLHRPTFNNRFWSLAFTAPHRAAALCSKGLEAASLPMVVASTA